MIVRPKVVTVVVTFNAGAWLRKCLDGLENSDYPIDIIVVDNHSTDDTLDYLKARASLQYLAMPDNVGFGKANNVGISMALEQGADYVFLLNQDAFIEQDTIEKLVAGMIKNPTFGILSPLHLNADGTAIDPAFARYIVTEGAELYYSDLLFGRLGPEKVYSLRYANAAAWMVSATCLQVVGGFDPLFFMYGEDDDYCRRVLRHGFQIGMLPSAVVCHARGKGDPAAEKRNTRQRFQARYSREKARSIVELKAPGNFLHVVALWYLRMYYTGIRELINRDAYLLAVHVLAAMRVAMLLPKIFVHRRKSARPGAIWLNNPGK